MFKGFGRRRVSQKERQEIMAMTHVMAVHVLARKVAVHTGEDFRAIAHEAIREGFDLYHETTTEEFAAMLKDLTLSPPTE